MAYYEEEKLDTKKLNIRMLARLKAYILRYKLEFAANMLINLVAIVPSIIDPHIIKISIDKYIFAADFRGIFFISLIFLGNRFFGWLVTILNATLSIRLGQKILNDIRMEVFNHVQKLSMEYFDRTPQGRIIARADTDLDTMEHVMTWGVGIFLNSFLTLVGTLYFMSRYNAKLCLAVSVVLPFLFVATDIFRRAGMKTYRKLRETATRITTNLAENISGIKVVQAFVREEKNLDDFREITSEHVKNSINSNTVWSTYFPFIGILSAAGTCIILFYGGYLVSAHQLKIGELSAYLLYLGMFFGPIFMMGELYNSFLATGTAAERIFQLLDTKPKVTDNLQSPGITLRGEVKFENVNFKYKELEKDWILKNINFEAKPGEVIALVGPTGHGKTTIVNLLSRFYEPQEGKILVDAQNLSGINTHSLRSQMGIVPQDSFLFLGTVMENLKYGSHEVSDEKVISAAKELGLHQFIEKLDSGYQTQVKERGVGLSEGERQLICITRVFVADPKILIFDEATSAVDTHTETVIQQAMEKLLRQRTCFVIAQRLSTIRKANMILVIRNGEIVERGTHQELLNLSGFYCRMYKEFISLK